MKTNKQTNKQDVIQKKNLSSRIFISFFFAVETWSRSPLLYYCIIILDATRFCLYHGYLRLVLQVGLFPFYSSKRNSRFYDGGMKSKDSHHFISFCRFRPIFNLIFTFGLLPSSLLWALCIDPYRYLESFTSSIITVTFARVSVSPLIAFASLGHF